MSIPDILRQFVSEDELILYGGMISAIPGIIFMVGLGVSILRIHFAIKHDGKEPPGLGVITLMEFPFALMSSDCRFKKKIQYQAEHGVDYASINYALIYPFIKPKDRYVARAWMFFGLLSLVWGSLVSWLYP